MASQLSSGIRSISLSSDEVVDHPVIAAIDFGTSSSGYAFVLKKEGSNEIKLSDIQLNKWQLGSASSSTDKAPTTVLLKPDKTFDSFGYKAEDKYAKLCDTRKQKGWWYFERFKMMLYREKLSREVMLDDAEGRAMPAKTVFSVVIGHLKDCVLENVMRQNPSTKEDDILYVLTVPAIWSDAAKQFMREAATDSKVQIKDSQLRLVLEPEAASVFCRQRDSRFVRDMNGKARLESLEVGHKYIILDLGGGTADIATHKIIENGQLHEIDYARGDNLGGQRFNESFLQFLNDLFGEDIFREWKNKKHSDYLRLQRAIEGIKWEVANDDDDILFEVPYTLVKHFQNEARMSVQEKMSQSRFRYKVKVIEDVQFLLNNYFVVCFFDTILTGVTHHMRAICKNNNDIETIFMVGGLAKSSYVENFIKSKFPQCTLVVPEDPGVAVMKGAVMLGNKPQTIAGRIARYSYGIGINLTFVEGEHNEQYKFTRDGQVLCNNVFDKLIGKGQVLKYGDTFTTTTHVNAKMPETKQQVFDTNLYQSISKTPSYFTEPGCTKLGGIKEYPPEGGWPDYSNSEVKIIVGEAEFKFHVSDSLGRKYETTVDFLAHK